MFRQFDTLRRVGYLGLLVCGCVRCACGSSDLSVPCYLCPDALADMFENFLVADESDNLIPKYKEILVGV